MKRQPLKVKELLEKAKDSALLAVEIYNKPRTSFKSGGFIVLMSIAWLSIFHAIFERGKVRYFYKNNGHYKIIDGERKAWELEKCVKEYYKDKNIPQRKNLEFFIKLRNKIEHRFLPQLDLDIFGECQAMLINFESLITKEFGNENAINENLVFALQFSSILQDKQQQALKIRESKEYKNVKSFLDEYRSNLSDTVKNSLNYSFKVFLIPKVGRHEQSSDVAIEFIKYDPSKPGEQERYKNLLVAIKEKQVPMVGFSANQVCKKVFDALQSKMPKDWKFRPSAQHVRCWKYFKVRPPSNSSTPEKTEQKFCFYNPAFKMYEYTGEWVNFLIVQLKNNEIFEKVMATR